MQPGEKQLGEMQYFNTTPLCEMQPGEKQFGEMQLSQDNDIYISQEQKIFSATDEIKILIENYKSKEINLFYNGCNRNELVKLWKDCLIDLNDININLK
ncbi:hypothetical protein H8356DRAFT_1327157 [Neocallimastix lanati (nom. inval.)]|nr:hypothetical protein H8356DRAFT_1327157 [Neocallimastix sp. JGI-2020a]